MLNLLRKSKGLLGINARNLKFIRRYNSHRSIKLADDKLQSKEVMFEAGLPVADLIAVIRDRNEYYNFDWDLLPSSFVLKPNKGLGGEGILITFGRKRNGLWIMSKDRTVGLDEIKDHVLNILDGDYSKTHAEDEAFFEERLKIHPNFKLYAYKGVPDIRVIVFNKVPVMAMLRLPTKESDGKANLHMGGIGVGIDIASGITTNAIQNDKLIESLPEANFPLRGIKIPFWNKILNIAIASQDASKLKYVGVDIAVDREKGPVILELNARPGLSIQVANLAPLKERLLRVQGLKIKTAERGIKVAKNLFGGEIEQEIEEITGKQVLGLIEKVKVKGKVDEEIELEAKIDTGAASTSIDIEIARELGYSDAIDFFNQMDISTEGISRENSAEFDKEVTKKILGKHPDIMGVATVFSSHGVSVRPKVKMKVRISGKIVDSTVSLIDRSLLIYPMIIGKKDLKDFIIDPSKK